MTGPLPESERETGIIDITAASPASSKPPATELSLIEAARLQAQHRSRPALRTGTGGGTIPGYQVLRELHRGGQGVVYLAIQEGTRRKVAIKVMRDGPFTGPQDRIRFEREVQVLAQINNPNIVGILDSGTYAGSHYYVMDYVSGHALDDHVKLNEPSQREVLDLFRVVCEAVNAAHLRGVIHRDLKPSNIRVTPQGVPQVLDFGLAKVSEAGVAGGFSVVTQMTQTGQFVGSLPWSSPEQARGEGDKIDVRTDVYALGVILYQILCGRFPYKIEGPMAEVIESISRTEPVRPRTLNKQISSELEMLMLKPLAKQREFRYQTAGEFARDIQRFLDGDPLEAKRGNLRYLARKLLRRYWLGVSVTVFALVVASFVLSAALLGSRKPREIDMLHERLAVLEEARALEAKQSEDLKRRLQAAEEALRAAGLPVPP